MRQSRNSTWLVILLVLAGGTAGVWFGVIVPRRKADDDAARKLVTESADMVEHGAEHLAVGIDASLHRGGYPERLAVLTVEKQRQHLREHLKNPAPGDLEEREVERQVEPVRFLRVPRGTLHFIDQRPDAVGLRRRDAADQLRNHRRLNHQPRRLELLAAAAKPTELKGQRPPDGLRRRNRHRRSPPRRTLQHPEQCQMNDDFTDRPPRNPEPFRQFQLPRQPVPRLEIFFHQIILEALQHCHFIYCPSININLFNK